MTRSHLERLLASARDGLLEAVARDPGSGLWLSPPLSHGGSDGPESRFRPLELRRSANRGVAGVVYVLSKLSRLGFATDPLRSRVAEAAGWLMADGSCPDAGLPGLHFGEAGVALALTEAVRAGLLSDRSQIAEWSRAAFAVDLDWPDVTHGAAGQGIAALRCGDVFEDPEITAYARECARYLVEQQQADGSWRVPEGVDGMSGQVLTGFAHGVAGIVYFLTEVAHRFEDLAAEAAWRRGADWLVGEAMRERRGALVWAYGDQVSERWYWWCHGGPGIALAFLRAYERTGESRYAELAASGLASMPAAIRYYNLSQCHGLSGLGEIYLEAGRLLGGPWQRRARDVARTLAHLRSENDAGAVTWLVEDPHAATGDLMVGCGGVVHFLLRLVAGGEGLGFPLLLEPAAGGSPAV